MLEQCKSRRLPVILVLATLLLGACATERTREAPGVASGVVLVTLDALRPDLVSTFGGEIEIPALDRLASSGTVYFDVLTVTPMTRPSLATLMTGVAPDSHGVLDDVNDRLGTTRRTLSEAARASGRKTAAFVSTPMASWASGLDRGFDLFSGPDEVLVGPARYFPEPLPGIDVAETFGEWLAVLPSDASFFCWVHLADLHGVASDTPTPGHRDYQKKIPDLDAALDRVFRSIMTWAGDAPVEVIVVGTHGTLVHGESAVGASFWLTPETLRVPLVVASLGPGGARDGERQDRGRRWLPDVHASLLARFDGPGTTAAAAVSLSMPPGQIEGRTRYAWTWATDDELDWPTLTGVDAGGALRVFTLDELQGPSVDPDDPLRAAAADRPATPRVRRLSDETRARLVEVGYSPGDGRRRTTVPEAEDRIAILRDVEQLKHHFAENRERRVAKMTRRVLEEHPESFPFLVDRLTLMTMAGEATASQPVVDSLLALYPDRQETFHWAAHRELLLEAPDRAVILLEAALEVGPVEAEIFYDLACARALKGDSEEALGHLHSAVESGYRNWRRIESDVDLASVRSHPDYVELMRTIRR